MKISTKRLWLRPIQASDNETLRTWRNAHREVYFDTSEIDVAKQDKWYQRYTALPPGTDLMFIIRLHTGEEIGTMALYDIRMHDRTATIGRVLILEKFRGHDYAREAVQGLVSFAFDTMHLHQLSVETDLTNNAAISIYHKCGFSITGMRYIQTSKTNLYRLIVLMEAINPDHSSTKPLQLVALDS